MLYARMHIIPHVAKYTVTLKIGPTRVTDPDLALPRPKGTAKQRRLCLQRRAQRERKNRAKIWRSLERSSLLSAEHLARDMLREVVEAFQARLLLPQESEDLSRFADGYYDSGYTGFSMREVARIEKRSEEDYRRWLQTYGSISRLSPSFP